MEQTEQKQPMSKSKKVKIGTAAALAGALAVSGTMAFFTDRAEEHASATAGTVDIELTSDWQDVANFNPGDAADLSYEISSIGNKSIDVREKFVVTSSEVMSDSGQAEFEIYARADVQQDANGAYHPVEGAEPITTGAERIVSEDGKTITYVMDQYVLNGTGEAAETEDGINETEKQSEYVLVFKSGAQNAFQGADVTVDFLAEAKQHRNTGDDTWTEIANESVTLGGTNVNAVPQR